ncbi:MAG TPA: polysaccharide pyruvyl transferase family protein [Thermoanaerobaculia bacterium]|nr:polysaccharide pyruvyl transferase family protein [Thermoanaerobaculia bacterium]
MSEPARSILIAGYYGHGNAGDEAILAALLADLRGLDRLDRGLAFTVVSGDPARTIAEHGVTTVPERDIAALAAAMRAADLVIVGGGGLFQSYWQVDPDSILTAGHGGIFTYLGYPALASLLGKPVLLYAVGVGPLPDEAGRQAARLAFELSQRATVRDDESLALLREIGLPEPAAARIEVVADPAFGLAPAAPETIAARLAGLGIRPGEPLCGVALRYWDFGPDPAAWEAEVARGLDRFLQSFSGRLLFLPFQSEEGGKYEDDLAVHRRIAAALADPDRAVLVETVLPPRELAGLLGRCGPVLAMRFHAALFALAAGVPVVNLAYDPKTRALLTRAGLGEQVLEPEDWTAESVAAALERAADHKPDPAFAARMRPLARRGAEIALDILRNPGPGRAEADRFLFDLAVRRILAADESARTAAERAAQIERQWAELSQMQVWIDGLRKEREEIRKEHDEQRARADGNAERASKAGEECDGLRVSFQRLREQRDLLLAERNDLARRLGELEGTLAFRIVSRFWALMRRLFPEGSRRRGFYRGVQKLLGKPASAPPAGTDTAAASETGEIVLPGGMPAPDPRGDLLRFEDHVRDTGARQVVAVFSATLLLESEGQRPTQLALELAKRKIPVVFFYWRWWKTEWSPQDRLDDGIVQIPIDVVVERPEMLTAAFAGIERIALFEFPYPGFFDVLAAANAAGWITVYDVLDDWEEFHRVGQAVWYDEPFERHLIHAADAVYAINDFLAARIHELGGEGTGVIGNGLKPGLEIVRDPRPLARGEITVGYFGYLAGAWFDWELIAEAARRRPTWRFYLIGYGGSPEGITLPGNIELLGKQPQSDLAAFAANWDVAIIPFKPDRLAAGADPIKTYEYLAMGLPVVVTGVYGPSGGERFVLRAEGVEQFLDALARAASSRSAEDVEARQAFAASCTWARRLDALLESVAHGEQRVAEKRALFGEDR